MASSALPPLLVSSLSKQVRQRCIDLREPEGGAFIHESPGHAGAAVAGGFGVGAPQERRGGWEAVSQRWHGCPARTKCRARDPFHGAFVKF